MCLFAAGHYVPNLSLAVVKHNENKGVLQINFKGFLVGGSYLGLPLEPVSPTCNVSFASDVET